MIINPSAQLRDLSAASVLKGILQDLPIPKVDDEEKERQRPAGMPSR
jgi:hypothetical protein